MSGENATPACSELPTPPVASVRPIAPADVARVWELLRGLAAYERLTDVVSGDAGMLREALFGRGDRLRGLVAERAGRLVGYALFYPVFASFRARWRLWLEDLYVEPEARGSGAGAALMAELARLALDGGYLALDWEVLAWNRPALEFYEHAGARRIATDWLRYRLEGDALERMAGRRERTC
jgi:GNAT superfamily N-acetyltransferase